MTYARSLALAAALASALAVPAPASAAEPFWCKMSRLPVDTESYLVEGNAKFSGTTTAGIRCDLYLNGQRVHSSGANCPGTTCKSTGAHVGSFDSYCAIGTASYLGRASMYTKCVS